MSKIRDLTIELGVPAEGLDKGLDNMDAFQDFERTSGGLAEQMAILKASIDENRDAFGKYLMPHLGKRDEPTGFRLSRPWRFLIPALRRKDKSDAQWAAWWEAEPKDENGRMIG